MEPTVAQKPDSRTKKQRAEKRWGALKSERSPWLTDYQEVADFLFPRGGRFFTEDRNKGSQRSRVIHNETATQDLETLESGMMSGATSPARPWFRLDTRDPELAKLQPVRQWLDDVTDLILRVFNKSNTYTALHGIYGQLGAFGTGASIVLPDFENVIHHYPVPVGEYCIGQNSKGRVDTFYREFQMTVAQVVHEFGWDNASLSTKSRWNSEDLDGWVTVLHAIEPRRDRDPNLKDAKNMPWSSCYYEVGTDGDKPLRESGFRRFPVLVPRWTVLGSDSYGISPGMKAMGTIKGLQFKERSKADAIALKIDPPLVVPQTMTNRELDAHPGGRTTGDASTTTGVRTLYEVNLDLSDLREDIIRSEERIHRSFFADLFRMLSMQGQDARMTATEVAERHEEKLIALGPVLERLHNELLAPLVEMTFEIMLEMGMLPPPPEELSGQDVSPEFISMLAQAQRAIGTNSIDRFVGSLGMVAQMKPEVLDNFDADKWASEYGDMLGVPAALRIDPADVAALRTARAKAMAAKEQAAAMREQAATAKDLAAAPTGGEQQTALTDILNQFSGYGSPSPSQV